MSVPCVRCQERLSQADWRDLYTDYKGNRPGELAQLSMHHEYVYSECGCYALCMLRERKGTCGPTRSGQEK